MQGRFQRGKIGGVSPFFAFQDIITSAMAVLITIVMLLALDMGEGGAASPGEPAAASLSQRLAGILDDLSRANAELRAAQEAASASRDPAILKGEIDLLKGELAQVRGQDQSSQAELSDARRHDATKVVRSEVEKQKAVVAAAAKQTAQREEEAARSLADMQRAEEAQRAAEAQLLAEQARKNEMWLIPDRSKTSKEPVLAIVSTDAVVLQRFDHPEKTELGGRKLISKFEDALKAFSKQDQYIVFYFRPSGVEHFLKLTDAAKSAGFEIGYDVVGEQIAINFSTAK